MQPTDVLTCGLAGIILHEMAHMATAVALKVRIHQVGMNWKGPYIRRESGTNSQNLAITLAGPGINIALSLFFFHVNPGFALCNLVLGVSNLLPLPSSDGSRALRLL